jgi:hypothetical protein
LAAIQRSKQLASIVNKDAGAQGAALLFGSPLVVRQLSSGLKRNVTFVFKALDEYNALARPEGRTIVFGASYGFRIPK